METNSALNNPVILSFAFICAGIILSGCATGKHNSSWTTLDSFLLSTALAFHGSDWMQTKDGVINKKMKEGNQFLGRHPDEENIDLYFASTAMGMSALSVTATKRQRRALLIAWNFLELVSVMHNHSAGIKIDIKI